MVNFVKPTKHTVIHQLHKYKPSMLTSLFSTKLPLLTKPIGTLRIAALASLFGGGSQRTTMRSPFKALTNAPNTVQSPHKPAVRPLCALAPGAEPAEVPSNQALTQQNLTEHPVHKNGAIELIMGPMFAGKTTRLLQRAHELELAGKKVLLVKSRTDDRYAVEEVVSHAGMRRKCIPVGRLHELASNYYQEFLAADVIAVDETQFMPDAEWFAQWAADKHCKRVIMAGLDGDYKRRKFGQMLDIVPCADSIVKLSARCQYCETDGRTTPAVFTLRKVADDRQEVVGGAETYAPVCRHCYLSLSKLAEWSGADSETSSIQDGSELGDERQA